MENDICKCTGDNCPIHLKESCRRYLIKADIHQTYFVESPIEDGNEECEQYWEVN